MLQYAEGGTTMAAPTILVYETDPDILSVFERTLRMAGYEVVGSRDLPQVNTLELKPPNVLLVPDPRTDEQRLFLRRIRENDSLSSLQIGMTSGDYFMPAKDLEQFALWKIEIRYRPVWMKDLVELVRKLAPIHGGKNGPQNVKTRTKERKRRMARQQTTSRRGEA